MNRAPSTRARRARSIRRPSLRMSKAARRTRDPRPMITRARARARARRITRPRRIRNPRKPNKELARFRARLIAINRALLVSDAAQEFVDADLGAGPGVHLFDDDGAVEAVTAVLGRQVARDDDG